MRTSVSRTVLVGLILSLFCLVPALSQEPADGLEIPARGEEIPAGDGEATADQDAPVSVREPDGRLTVALTGDSIITRALSPYGEPEFLEMIERLRGADAAFTNLEVLLHDYETWPAHDSGGTWMRADPEMADELAWAGFDLVSMANNHTGDYGVEGLRLTMEYVDEAGLVAAGVGRSLAAAREAKFLETGDGRIALISMASTFTDHSVAGRSRDDIPPRPGLSPLRHRRWTEVPPQTLEALRQAATALGRDVPDDAERLRFLGETFVLGDELRRRTEPDPEDMEEIAAVVRNAAALSDLTIVTIHAHEGDGSRFVPAEFLVTFARAMVDAGADLFVGHGPHVLRGIEIYRGKPILYSLGDFVFQNETLLRLPYENYEPYELGPDHHVADFNDRRYDGGTRGFPARPEIWESVIALPTFVDGELAELELVPISLQHGEPPQIRGRPLLAPPDLSEKIIGDLIRLSEPFGTRIVHRDGVGVVDLEADQDTRPPGTGDGNRGTGSAATSGDQRRPVISDFERLRPGSFRHREGDP